MRDRGRDNKADRWWEKRGDMEEDDMEDERGERGDEMVDGKREKNDSLIGRKLE